MSACRGFPYHHRTSTAGGTFQQLGINKDGPHLRHVWRDFLLVGDSIWYTVYTLQSRREPWRYDLLTGEAYQVGDWTPGNQNTDLEYLAVLDDTIFLTLTHEGETRVYTQNAQILDAQLTAPAYTCPAEDVFTVSLATSASDPELVWQVVNGDLTSGQGSAQITIRPGSVGMTVAMVTTTETGGAPRTVEVAIPIIAADPGSWQRPPLPGTDLDGNGSIDIRDLILQNRWCSP